MIYFVAVPWNEAYRFNNGLSRKTSTESLRKMIELLHVLFNEIKTEWVRHSIGYVLKNSDE